MIRWLTMVFWLLSLSLGWGSIPAAFSGKVTQNGGFIHPQASQTLSYDLGSWTPLAVVDNQLAVQQAYLWGQDLSGQTGSALNGAGGIGGLTGIAELSNNTVTNFHFVGYDGNGNVSLLVRASDGAVSARYEYSPFGQLIRSTGVMAKNNPFRFSTKYWDD